MQQNKNTHAPVDRLENLGNSLRLVCWN